MISKHNAVYLAAAQMSQNHTDYCDPTGHVYSPQPHSPFFLQCRLSLMLLIVKIDKASIRRALRENEFQKSNVLLLS